MGAFPARARSVRRAGIYWWLGLRAVVSASLLPFTGWLLDGGRSLTAVDIAILLMSMHMCLQIFPHARSIFGHDGLYPVRKYVYAIWFVLPHIIASLAFINSHGGYISSGAFCFLPVRPFWYRLALFWVPRYLIWVYITYVAIRIYRHVGAEFKVFGQERDQSSSMGMPGESSIDRAKQRDEVKRRASQANTAWTEKDNDDTESCAPDDMSCKFNATQDSTKSLHGSTHGRDGAPEWSTIGFTGESTLGTPANRSMPTSRRGSRMLAPGILSEDFAPPPTFDASRHRGSITSLGSKRSAGHTSFAEDLGLPPITEGLPSQSAAARSDPSHNTANKTMELRRRAIQRQLRLLFIYPCVYVILWIIPFAAHCMNYTTYYAHHPIFGLNVVQILCMAIMTFFDVVIFSWREKPWRHIPGSDGTFWGSLCWWRFAFKGVWARARRESRALSFPEDVREEEEEMDQAKEKSSSQTGLLASLKRWSLSLTGQSPRGSESSGAGAPPLSASTTRASVPHKRTYSGGSDRKHLEAERAHERLAMERAEYEQNRRSLQERRASVVSGKSQRGGKDWFDRGLDDELFRDGVSAEDERRGTV